jgi:hypothetical protein
VAPVFGRRITYADRFTTTPAVCDGTHFCAPSAPLQLWLLFRQHLCNDLRHHIRARSVANPSPDVIFDYGLFLLQRSLAQSGCSLDQFGLPPPAAAEDQSRLFNPRQADAFDCIVHSVQQTGGIPLQMTVKAVNSSEHSFFRQSQTDAESNDTI